ncbi:hypothetical protein SY89_00748 [Halolamina pelagica]|uniref:Uncharacterized protein n=1 Tax=Halolamina pelagica TaxID=699431 RepID=A0A0P7GN46_9EURY|nr:hypothetical protein SY89_00748 [Halolamina pelagica]
MLLEQREVLLWQVDVVDAVDALLAQALVVVARARARGVFGVVLVVAVFAVAFALVAVLPITVAVSVDAPVVVLAADGLDRVVGQVRAGRDQRVDVALPDQAGDDLPHPGGHHRPRQREEDGAVVVLEHLGVHVGGLVDCGGADAGVAILLDELAHAHPRADGGVPDRVVLELPAFGLLPVIGVLTHTPVSWRYGLEAPDTWVPLPAAQSPVG